MSAIPETLGRGDAAVSAIAAEHGALLCTLLRWDAPRELLVRAASSRPDAYPVGGAKHFERPWPAWLQACVGRGSAYAVDGADAVRDAFFDHELIASLGCTGYVTVPVLADGAVVGVLNGLGPDGWATPERLEALTHTARRHPLLVPLSTTEDA